MQHACLHCIFHKSIGDDSIGFLLTFSLSNATKALQSDVLYIILTTKRKTWASTSARLHL